MQFVARHAVLEATRRRARQDEPEPEQVNGKEKKKRIRPPKTDGVKAQRTEQREFLAKWIEAYGVASPSVAVKLFGMPKLYAMRLAWRYPATFVGVPRFEGVGIGLTKLHSSVGKTRKPEPKYARA